MKKSVLVAMSGGVDSAAAAYLLKQAGYDVTGVHIKVMDERLLGEAGVKSCCSVANQVAARQTAGQLGILLHVLNWEKEFHAQVIDYFIGEYLRGRTPNPCIICNQMIKFGLLLAKAREWGFTQIATGHYVQKTPTGQILRGVDKVKDQSYVLSSLTREQLAASLFPLGSLTKPEVRALMQEAGFLVAAKTESQEICFIPDNDYRGFLKKFASQVVAPGPIKDTAGKILGQHQGVAFYTIGQRKGLPAAGHPLYVKELNVAEKTLIVGSEAEVFSEELRATSPNWLVDLDTAELDVLAQIRYRHEPTPARIKIFPEHVLVKFTTSQRGVTPGQRVAFYQDNLLLGGAWIE